MYKLVYKSNNPFPKYNLDHDEQFIMDRFYQEVKILNQNTINKKIKNEKVFIEIIGFHDKEKLIEFLDKITDVSQGTIRDYEDLISKKIYIGEIQERNLIFQIYNDKDEMIYEYRC